EGAIEGSVRDEAGAPIAEAEVVATPSGDISTLVALEEFKAKSTADGSFRIGGLGGGAYGLTAGEEGWERREGGEARGGGGGTASGIALVLSEGNAIAGRVLDPAGAPAAGVPVKASFEASAFTMSDPELLAGGTGGRAVSGKDGTFRIAGLGKGPFKVKAKD